MKTGEGVSKHVADLAIALHAPGVSSCLSPLPVDSPHPLLNPILCFKSALWLTRTFYRVSTQDAKIKAGALGLPGHGFVKSSGGTGATVCGLLTSYWPAFSLPSKEGASNGGCQPLA